MILFLHSLQTAYTFNNMSHYSVFSQTIVDSGNKDIGAMDFVDAGPLASCEKGNRTVSAIIIIIVIIIVIIRWSWPQSIFCPETSRQYFRSETIL